MKSRIFLTIVFFLALFCIGGQGFAQGGLSPDNPESKELSASDKLVILWTSGDREVALKMVFMYTYNAKARDWWEDITLVVWGPSAKLLTEDKELQDYMNKILEAGVTVKACKGCSDLYGVSEDLEKLGITVLYIGKELTDYIKEGREMLTI